MRKWERTYLWLELIALAAATVVVLSAVHPNLVFSSSLVTGGDTGAHLALPAYLRTTGNLFNLTPWYPGWFAGMPAYTYYFIVPDFLAVLGSYVVGFAVSFKLVTLLGSFLMPWAAYAMGRLLRAPRPVPVALGMATLPFLFDASFTIDGGNLFSTMAGEYAFSLSLAFAMVAIGLMGRGMRTSRGYWLTGVVLALTLLSHVLPFFFVLGATAVLALYELIHRRWGIDPEDEPASGDYARPIRFAVGSGLIALGLTAWWLWPFATSQQYTNSMGYTNDPVNSFAAVGKVLGWFNASGGPAGDRWVIVAALGAAVLSFWQRSRVGIFLTFVTLGSLVAFLVDPQGVIWNERLVPFWFLGTHLLVGWLVGDTVMRVAAARPKPSGEVLSVSHDEEAIEVVASVVDDAEDDEDGVDEHGHEVTEQTGRRMGTAIVSVLLIGLLSVVPGQVTPLANALGLSTSGNQVSSWAQWNYAGYQGTTAWPEYHRLMNTMDRIGHRHGCGRAMWEYGADQNRFGTPMALMLLPYWTNNCINSMEGLFFESSATTPYHFIDQALLSAQPSNPQVGLPYSDLCVHCGVPRLQMLGVRYFVAYFPTTVDQANRLSDLKPLSVLSRVGGASVIWHIYQVRHSSLVEGLRYQPVVVPGLSSRTAWLKANVKWWAAQNLPAVVAAEDGPSTWARASTARILHLPQRALPVEHVTHVVQGTQSLSFHVDKIGVPTLVKISYYPRWHAEGAEGPYRVSPNLMVVIPTSHDVTLTYGASAAVVAGNLVTDAFVTLGLALAAWRLRNRRVARSRIANRANQSGL